jgi:hypothetical protein
MAMPDWGQCATCASELVVAFATGCCSTLPELEACSSGQLDCQGPAWDSVGEAIQDLVSVDLSHRS